ncbi:hypothetical protein [Phosphitispora sp. TUW77]
MVTRTSDNSIINNTIFNTKR